MPSLNPAQQAAVDHEQGPLLVLAGAGSGKTRVITHRIARLLERGVRPEAILAVSFTNKAAEELAERVGAMVGEARARKIWLSTFHRFGARFLTEEARGYWGDDRYVIFDQGDSVGLIRDLVKRAGVSERDLDVAAVAARISSWKNLLVAPEAVPESDFEYDAVAREIYPRYDEALRTMRAVDFDDLVVLPVRMLQERPELQARWRERFRHLLIDEFQDTNRSQLALVKMLTNGLGNVCVVGDDDQAIYGWRGADVRNILEFPKHFPGTRIVTLEENYRSFAPILTVANAVSGANKPEAMRKELRAVRGSGEAVRLCVARDAAEEARMVAREIRALTRDRYRLRDIAILYRSNLQARLLEEELRVQGFAYRLLGGTQYFDRKEVKDALAYLRVLLNPKDDLSMRRAIATPPRGIGPAALEKMGHVGRARNLSLRQVLGIAPEIAGLPAPALRGARDLHFAFERAEQALQRGQTLATTARALFDDVGFREDLLALNRGAAGTRRCENLDFLLRSIERFEQSQGGDKTTLASFLARLSLRLPAEEEAARDAVTLSTLHAAKGLEFPVVFLVGCVEGILPHSRTTDPKVTDVQGADIEEERRLFYVGVTRAQDILYLMRPAHRSMRGRTQPLAPSRFLEGLPEEALCEYGITIEETPDHEEVEAITNALLARLSGQSSGLSQTR